MIASLLIFIFLNRSEILVNNLEVEGLSHAANNNPSNMNLLTEGNHQLQSSLRNNSGVLADPVPLNHMNRRSYMTEHGGSGEQSCHGSESTSAESTSEQSCVSQPQDHQKTGAQSKPINEKDNKQCDKKECDKKKEDKGKEDKGKEGKCNCQKKDSGDSGDSGKCNCKKGSSSASRFIQELAPNILFASISLCAL